MSTKKRVRLLFLFLLFLLSVLCFLYGDITLYSLDSYRYTSGKDFFKVVALDLKLSDFYSVNCLTDDENIYYVPEFCDKNVADIVLARDHKTVNDTLEEHGCIRLGETDEKVFYETKDGRSFMVYQIAGEKAIAYRTNAIVGVTLDEIIES